MANENDSLESYIKEVLDHIKDIPLREIPDIELYMDQVTSFMDDHLDSIKRYPEDKALTKTMINNYAKNHLLPPPVRKKYSREHMILLILIYYFKGFLSFHDIRVLLEPLNNSYFQAESGTNLASLYEEMLNLIHQDSAMRQADIFRMMDVAGETFSGNSEKDPDFLTTFSLVCLLSYDVFSKKYLIERLIDRLEKSRPKEENVSKKEAKKRLPD